MFFQYRIFFSVFQISSLFVVVVAFLVGFADADAEAKAAAVAKASAEAAADPERSILDSGYSRTATYLMRTAMKLPPHILPTLDEIDATQKTPE